MVSAALIASLIWFFISDQIVVSAFQPSGFGTGFLPAASSCRLQTQRTSTIRTASPFASSRKTTKLCLSPEIHELAQFSVSVPQWNAASILLSASESESWRQYVPLVVTGAVIIDILLGSPLANLALGPMKRASEKGATGDQPMQKKNVIDRSKERVDTDAIAQAAIDKARNTLELKRFLEENKTNEQKYEDMRKKIDRQMDELE